MGAKLKIDEKEFTRLWLEENLDRYEMAAHFGCSTGPIDKTIRRLGLKKTQEQINEITKRHNRKKWGCDYPNQSEAQKEKICQTNMERYGVPYTGGLPGVREKYRTTMLERYGVENPSLSAELCERRKQTCRDRYGVDNPLKSVEIQEKRKATLMTKYGTLYPGQLEVFKKKAKETLLYKNGVSINNWGHLEKWAQDVLASPEALQRYIEQTGYTTTFELSRALGYSRSKLIKRLHKYNLFSLIDSFSSVPEKELGELLDSWGIRHEKSRDIIAPYEIDLYCPEFKVGIEFNGIYWHSDERLPRTYHQKKSLLAESKGVFIYHIFEQDWEKPKQREKIIMQLKNLFGKNEHRIFARECEVRELNAKEKNEFLEKNHFQGKDNAKVSLGLFYNNELVSVMTFSRDRFAKKRKYDWELSRFCSKENTSVIGGASKLFKHFISFYSGTIISYSNISRTRGGLYQKLGFELLQISEPDYVWVNSHTGEVLSRYQTRGKNEKQIMTDRGFYRIYGCGNKVWIYKN